MSALIDYWNGLSQGSQHIQTKTSSYTITTSDDLILVDTSAGAVTITLPAASSATGYVWNIYKITSDANAVTIARAGSGTINGATSKTISANNTGVQITGATSSTWLASTLTAA